VNVSLEGIEIDNTVGSLARLAEALWVGDAITKHKEGERCLELFKVYCIGKQTMSSDRTVFLTFTTVWNLLNFWRSVGTGFDVQLHGDVAATASWPGRHVISVSQYLAYIEGTLCISADDVDVRLPSRQSWGTKVR
jgi:hypothetical protein